MDFSNIVVPGAMNFPDVAVPVETIEQRRQRNQRNFLDNLDRQFDRRRLSPRLSPIAPSVNNPQRTPPGQNQSRYWMNNQYYDPVDGWVQYPSPPTPPRPPTPRKRVPRGYGRLPPPRRDVNNASSSRMFSEDGDALNTSFEDDRIAPLRMQDIRGYSPRRARRIANQVRIANQIAARRNLAQAFNNAASDTSSVNSEDIEALYGDTPPRPRRSPVARKRVITAFDLSQAIQRARRDNAPIYQPSNDQYDSDNDSLYQ